MDELDKLDDVTAAKAFRSLVRHLRHRTDAQNIDLMGLSGFCRNCLADWIVEADSAIDREEARRIIYDMPFSEWKAQYQTEATPEQIGLMEESLKKNKAADRELDDELDDSFPASDPPSITQPGH